MPISRDPRLERRRRVLRENSEPQPPEPATNSRSRRKSIEETSDPPTRRGAGYSQDVRNVCGHRLVQLIPIRRRSYAAAILASFLIPALLLLAHYMVYVNGRLPWYGHPLAVALDASHPRGIAAWFISHLWLLCFGATLLTFQLRRHKLDDYSGEYRLWFWLVISCLLASVDSTTHISELFGFALERWSQTHLGWSGPAIVKATLAVLIGILGLRLCNELKSVPLSLILWLGGLVAWAASAALGQDEFKTELTLQFRIWLRCAFWLGGLTAIWVAALTYLRHVYMEAQHRFLLRGRLATASSAVPLGRRLRESLPGLPRLPSLPAMPRLRRERTLLDDSIPEDTPQRGWKSHSLQQQPQSAAEIQSSAPTGAKPTSWFRRPKDDDDAVEFRKVRAAEKEQATGERTAHGASRSQGLQSAGVDEQPVNQPSRRWLPKFGRAKLPRIPVPRVSLPKLALSKLAMPKLLMRKPKSSKLNQPELKQPAPKQTTATEPKVKQAKVRQPKVKPAGGGWLSKLKLPAFGLSGLKLTPPQAPPPEPSSPTGPRPLPSARPLPSTSSSPTEAEDEDDHDSSRPLSKAERKRQRREQQNRAA